MVETTILRKFGCLFERKDKDCFSCSQLHESEIPRLIAEERVNLFHILTRLLYSIESQNGLVDNREKNSRKALA